MECSLRVGNGIIDDVLQPYEETCKFLLISEVAPGLLITVPVAFGASHIFLCHLLSHIFFFQLFLTIMNMDFPQYAMIRSLLITRAIYCSQPFDSRFDSSWILVLSWFGCSGTAKLSALKTYLFKWVSCKQYVFVTQYSSNSVKVTN